VIGENATVDHSKMQRESESAFHVGSLHVAQERSSQLTTHSISLGGAIVRSDIDTALGGEGSGCVLNGLYLVRGQQHVDQHTFIDHARAHCDSHELYKGILDGKSRGVFDGRIVVQKDAQKTNSGQVNRNLLLSSDAIIDTKPQLEIHADDVKCTHGSTIGQLDESSIFYLRSRGIGLEEARQMLTYAFASEVLDRIKVPSIRTQLEAVLLERLGTPGSSGGVK
jgi:FeS assembly protein SufD